MVQSMRSDHQTTAAECNCNFQEVGGEVVPKPCRTRDAAEAADHDEEHGNATMFTEAQKESEAPEERNQQREATVNSFFRRQEVREDRR